MQKLTKKIIINAGIYENRVAILDKGILEEFYVEQETEQQFYGNIYKGKVETVIPGIGAAFVNIGTGKNGFLYISDVMAERPQALDETDDFFIEYTEKTRNSKIEDLLKVGQEVLVQVIKEPISAKGPRLTTHLSIPSRYGVLTPFEKTLGVSKRILDVNERSRIKEILKRLKMPEGAGCILRTAARDVTENDLRREIRYLSDLWGRIKYRAKKIKAPAIIYEEYGLILRTVRDQFTDDVEKLVIDSKDKYKRIMRFLNFFMPALKSRIVLYKGIVPVFEKYGIEEEIEKVFERKISLKSGGSIIIEQTEGMVAIDVNTEKYKGKRDIEETIFRTNLEAAHEIARQIRLRDIGGIIIIDFIDMKAKEHKIKVQEALETSLKRDKAKTNIFNISPIGVVEMTRQRMRKSLESATYKKCPYCDGRGLVKSDTTIAMHILRKIEKTSFNIKKRELMVTVHPNIFAYLMENKKETIFPLEHRCRKRITFHSNATLHPEDVQIE